MSESAVLRYDERTIETMQRFASQSSKHARRGGDRTDRARTKDPKRVLGLDLHGAGLRPRLRVYGKSGMRSGGAVMGGQIPPSLPPHISLGSSDTEGDLVARESFR